MGRRGVNPSGGEKGCNPIKYTARLEEARVILSEGSVGSQWRDTDRKTGNALGNGGWTWSRNRGGEKTSRKTRSATNAKNPRHKY